MPPQRGASAVLYNFEAFQVQAVQEADETPVVTLTSSGDHVFDGRVTLKYTSWTESNDGFCQITEETMIKHFKSVCIWHKGKAAPLAYGEELMSHFKGCLRTFKSSVGGHELETLIQTCEPCETRQWSQLFGDKVYLRVRTEDFGMLKFVRNFTSRKFQESNTGFRLAGFWNLLLKLHPSSFPYGLEDLPSGNCLWAEDPNSSDGWVKFQFTPVFAIYLQVMMWAKTAYVEDNESAQEKEMQNVFQALSSLSKGSGSDSSAAEQLAVHTKEISDLKNTVNQLATLLTGFINGLTIRAEEPSVPGTRTGTGYAASRGRGQYGSSGH